VLFVILTKYSPWVCFCCRESWAGLPSCLATDGDQPVLVRYPGQRTPRFDFVRVPGGAFHVKSLQLRLWWDPESCQLAFEYLAVRVIQAPSSWRPSIDLSNAFSRQILLSEILCELWSINHLTAIKIHFSDVIQYWISDELHISVMLFKTMQWIHQVFIRLP